MHKVLIANRGEIAVRIIRACREMNIKTVAIYSDIDKTAMHTKLADESICVGNGPSFDSYLNIKNIIEAACLTGCDYIHPGYGFLSENTHFAKVCEESNIKFIAPSYNVINIMGNKSNAKALVQSADVPVIPGSDGIIKTLKQAKALSKTIGYPIILKASAGGGGKGIRIVEKERYLEECFNIVKKEAKISFNNDDIYLEKYIQNPRHVEVQVLADEFGSSIHLGERDCSIQRRNQKMLEESPSTVLDDNLRNKMGESALKIVRASNYSNAGTVEFLVDKDKNFYFMEMNTRIQVEHPITEVLTGIDLVKEQIRIAFGEKLKLKQSDIKFMGHSIECRINAERPNKKFMPCPGEIKELNIPGGNGVRVDTSVYTGYNIPPIYDSMIAKVIVHGKNRYEAIAKMRRALEEFVIYGIDTNIDFLYKILENTKFISGDFDTNFIKDEFNM